MNILIFASDTEYKLISETLKKTYVDANCNQILDNEQMLRELATGCTSLVIIAIDGASGMELAISVRNANKDIPLFWFSDDINFGYQAYRINCNYFSSKPISENKLFKATQKI